ncbi:MAG: flavoprotein [Planctomycetota bacterium]|jgi:phosphopantothenoylcysteine decarboxylase|nr:phosphopantothenoylcysteine decarboxylase [Blastopirellula sp.]
MGQGRVLVGICGGIAAYKSAMLVSQLAQSGAEIRVVTTASAKEFIGEATLAALSGQPVVCDSFDRSFPLGPHIELARWADVLCIAPTTANFLAKAAQGLADDLLSTLYLCFEGPVLMAPAMNCEMWQKPAVQRNVTQLRSDGVELIDPQEGWLSCRVRGVGRMAEPAVIAEAVARALAPALARRAH